VYSAHRLALNKERDAMAAERKDWTDELRQLKADILALTQIADQHKEDNNAKLDEITTCIEEMRVTMGEHYTSQTESQAALAVCLSNMADTVAKEHNSTRMHVDRIVLELDTKFNAAIADVANDDQEKASINSQLEACLAQDKKEYWDGGVVGRLTTDRNGSSCSHMSQGCDDGTLYAYTCYLWRLGFLALL
jgi:hypothetical protein